MSKCIHWIKSVASIGLVLSICLSMSCSEDERISLPPRPNRDNTGFLKGMQLKDWTGSDFINSSNVTYEGYNFPEAASGYYTFAGNNVVLKNCKLQSGVLFAGDNIEIKYTEVFGGISLSGTANARISYNNIHSAKDDGIHITSDNGRVSVSFNENCG